MGIERYQLGEKLGQGGMGIVHKAKDLWTGEWVAIKTMTGYPDDDERDQKARERFEREIKMARSLQHEHILPIIDDGYRKYGDEQVPYLVSSYMADGSLHAFIKKTPPWIHWTLRQTADVIMQAADGLDYMHRHRPPKVHEDVKPENFLIRCESGPDRIVHLYVTDFGIAREQRTSSHMASQVIGTTPFMAPEQFEQRIHYASDQYALAIVACLLLTGKLPLQASTPEQWIYAHLYIPPTPPSVLNPQRVSSAKVDAIILRALSKKPEERFPSILEFANALYRVLVAPNDGGRTEPLSSSPIPPAEHSLPYTPLAPAPVLPVELAEKLLHSTKLPVEEIDEPLPLLPVHPSSARAEVEPPSFHALRQSLSGELGARPSSLVWSPDGNHILCILHEQPPILLSAEGKTEGLKTLRIAEAHPVACWSPDSRILAINSAVQNEQHSEILFWDIATKAVCLQPLYFPASKVYALDWSARGQLAIWVGSQIVVYTLPGTVSSPPQISAPQTLPIQAMRGSDSLNALRWSPDGLFLAAGAQDGALVCWNVDSRRLQWTEPAADHAVRSLAWNVDSSSLAVAFRNKRVVVWNVHERRQLTNWESLAVVPRMLSFASQQHLTIASDKPYLLFGDVGADSPSERLAGYWVAAWSPTRPELATLDGRSRTTLFVWRE